MIERYSRPEMDAIWGMQNRYQCWLDVEVAACKAMAEKGIIPKRIYRILSIKLTSM